jgi:hypothetical protein
MSETLEVWPATTLMLLAAALNPGAVAFAEY